MTTQPQTRAILGRLASDGMAIVLIQAINFLTPLAVLPFVSRALGLQGFGIYAAILVYVSYVVLFSDFSFNLTGPMRVQKAIVQGGLRDLVLGSALLKLALALLAIVPMAILAGTVLRMAPVDISLAGCLALSISLTPRWMMYGLGRLYSFAGVSALARLSWLIAVCLTVTTPDDLTLLLTLSVLCQVFICCACAFILIRMEHRSTEEPVSAWNIFREDWRQFMGVLASSSVRDIGVLALSLFATAAAVSVYAVADRVRTAIMGLVAPVTQTLFLFIIRQSGRPSTQASLIRSAASIVVILGSALGGAVVYFEAEWIVLVLGGPEFVQAADYLRILAAVPMLTALNAILGPNTLLAEGHSTMYANAQLSVAAIGIPITITLSQAQGARGTAISVLIIEALLTITLVYSVVVSGSSRVLLFSTRSDSQNAS